MNTNQSNQPSRINKQGSQNLQYVSQYDTSGYQQPQIPLRSLPFAQSSVGREPYHMPLPQHQTASTQAIQSQNMVARVKSEASRFMSSQVTNQQVFKGESRVSYVPYQKKVIEYENRTYVERVPIKKKVTKYEQRKVIETIPRQVIKQDYYAVQKRVEYHKEIIPEKRIEMVQVQKKVKRYEYVPVEKQIVHYPENVDLETAKSQSRIVLKGQGVQVKSDAEFKPINPTLLYNYSDRPASKHNPILYVDQGVHRVFSTAPTLAPHQYLQDQRFPSFTQNYLNPNQLSPRYFSNVQNGSLVRQQFQPEGQSYIKQLVSSNARGGELKRPFELIQQSKQQIRVQNNIAYDDYGQVQQFSREQPQKNMNFNIDNMDWATK